MQEIIKISKNRIGDSSVNSVSARELHRELGFAKSQFKRWIKLNLLDNPFFVQNIDYITIRHNVELPNSGYREVEDYLLTLEVAKHLAMLSRTEKAHNVRNYFIKVEKSYKLQISEPKLEKRTDLISVSQSELDKELQTLDFMLNKIQFSEKKKLNLSTKL